MNNKKLKERKKKMKNLLDSLSSLLDTLCDQDPYDFGDLTEKKIQSDILNTKKKVAGVYLFSKKQGNKPLYVGRTHNLAYRIGRLHRSRETNQAQVTRCIAKVRNETMSKARIWVLSNCTVRILRLDENWKRAILENYAAKILDTKCNSFKET